MFFSSLEITSQRLIEAFLSPPPPPLALLCFQFGGAASNALGICFYYALSLAPCFIASQFLGGLTDGDADY